MSPSSPSSCCQATFANRAPSGQGEMLPDCAAFTATSFPKMNRNVLLSPRSVVLISFQLSKDGSKANPLRSGCTADNEIGVAAASPPLAGCPSPFFLLLGKLGTVAHGAR